MGAAAAQWGRLDLPVNNGAPPSASTADLDAVTPEVWDRVLGVNVVGTWNVTRAAVPYLRTAGAGCVVSVGSLAGRAPRGQQHPLRGQQGRTPPHDAAAWPPRSGPPSA